MSDVDAALAALQFSHHATAVRAVTDKLAADPDVVAVVIGGSVVKHLARPDSDIDGVVVLRDGAPGLTEVPKGCYYWRLDDLYEGGYADIKIADAGYLHEAADHGSEPTRWAFVRALVTHCVDPVVPDLVARIARYPEAARERNVRDFVAQVRMMNWFAAEARKRDDAYLMGFAATRVALYAGRTVLALDRLLYPFHKWFLTELRRAPSCPAGLVAAIEDVTRAPSVDGVARVVDLVCGMPALQAWEPALFDDAAWDDAIARFTATSEQAWRWGPAPLEDR